MPKISVTALVALSLVTGVAATQAASPYQPFPNGYGYMEAREIAALKAAVAAGDHKTAREHGWKLWAGIMQPDAAGSWPIWFTWPNSKGAFAPSGGLATANATGKSLILLNAGIRAGQPAGGVIPVNIPTDQLPVYPIPQDVITNYPNAAKNCATQDNPNNICDGTHFAFNGDIMIPTESLSREGFDWIRGKRLYEQRTLDRLHRNGVKDLTLPARYIVTKHMFWPVKAGSIAAIPVWHDYHDGKYPDYAGYEIWPDMVGVDPSGQSIGKTVNASYLYGVLKPDQKTPWPTQTGTVTVYGLNDFYYHQVTQDDWNSFDEADKAILDASSWWANNAAFGPGDYLVTIAMHVNTREIPSWALQSVWWSDRPDKGSFSEDRPKLPQAKGPWDHYLLLDAYGIPEKEHKDRLPVATNPYIELVIHPVGTDCNNCHMRAGWPTGTGAGTSSYQNPDCPDSLAKLSPNSQCFKKYTRSDFQWIIPDRARK
jgi:hypothetical protein